MSNYRKKVLEAKYIKELIYDYGCYECLLECGHICKWFTRKIPKTMTCYICEQESNQPKTADKKEQP